MQGIETSFNFDYNEYKKRTNKSFGFPFSIILIIILLLTGLAIYIKPVKSSNYEFYFVEANAFSTYQQASSFAQEIQISDGAGYIHLDKQYHVLINFYKNKDDAESVLDNLNKTYKNAKIYKISAKKFKNVKIFSEKQNKSIEKLSNFSISLIKNLSSLSIDYDKKEKTFNQLSTIFVSYCENFNKLYDDFCKQFKTNSKQNVSREYAYNIKNNLQQLSKYNEESLETNFKYLLIDIVINYSSFVCSFWFFDLINSTSCQIASPIKKIANALVKISFFNLTATSAPPKLKTQPTTASNQVDLKSTSLFFMWIIIATTDIGKNATRLTPCACNCS